MRTSPTRIVIAALAAVGWALLGAATAWGSEVFIGVNGSLVYQAAPGENTTLTLDAGSAAGQVIVRDPGAYAIYASAGCQALDDHSASCAGVQSLDVQLADGVATVTNNTSYGGGSGMVGGIFTGSGDVSVAAGTTPMRVIAGPGTVSILASGVITGGSGNVVIHGGAGPNIIRGGSGNDIIYAGANGDDIVGGSGDDQIYGGPGNDSLVAGGNGNDLIVGGGGNDRIVGGGGTNTLVGGPGNDVIDGGGGISTVQGGGGNDVIDVRDGEGGDSVTCGPGNSLVRADLGDSVATNCATVLYGYDPPGIPSGRLTVARGGLLALRVRCRACHGQAQVVALSTSATTAAPTRTLGRGGYAALGGSSGAIVRVRIRAGELGRRPLRVRLRVTCFTQGVLAETDRTITLVRGRT